MMEKVVTMFRRFFNENEQFILTHPDAYFVYTELWIQLQSLSEKASGGE